MKLPWSARKVTYFISAVFFFVFCGKYKSRLVRLFRVLSRLKLTFTCCCHVKDILSQTTSSFVGFYLCLFGFFPANSPVACSQNMERILILRTLIFVL